MVLAKKCLAELSAVDSYQFTRKDWNMLPLAPLLLTISVSDRLWLFAPMQECLWSMAPLAVFLYDLGSSNMSVGIPDKQLVHTYHNNSICSGTSLPILFEMETYRNATGALCLMYFFPSTMCYSLVISFHFPSFPFFSFCDTSLICLQSPVYQCRF